MRYVPALDGLRAIAVIGVLISHYKLSESLNYFVDILPWGHIGVRLFFVLSGYLITSILINCRDLAETNGLSPLLLLRQFYCRRFLRIFPLFYAVILIAYLLDVGNIKEVMIYHVFYLSNTSSALTGTLEGYPHLLILLQRIFGL
jgi:peptidoglycan/LPS O-acetylase OafA/YrhL